MPETRPSRERVPLTMSLPARGVEAPLGPAAVRGGAFAAGALALALAVLLRRRLPEGLRAAVAAAWDPPIQALRQLHGGRIGESVAWLALGAAAIASAALALG